MAYFVTAPAEGAKERYRVRYRAGRRWRQKAFPGTPRGLRQAFAFQARLPFGTASTLMPVTTQTKLQAPVNGVVATV